VSKAARIAKLRRFPAKLRGTIVSHLLGM